MKDALLVDLFWQRDETAVETTQKHYRAYLHKVAYQILGDELDCEEIVNDVYLALWNSIPPHRPENLRAYAAKITRRLAIKRYEQKKAQKRVASEYAVSLEELREVGGDVAAPEEHPEELGRCISAFLRERSPKERRIFLRRYYYADPVEQIARGEGVSASAVYKALGTLREALRTYLIKEGYSL